jgi:VWFA-related protein
MRLLVGVLSILALLGVGPEVLPEARVPVYLSLSVQQRKGMFVRDLKLKEVSLKLDGKPVEIRFFGSENVEAAIVLLVENSPRTARYAVSIPRLGRINTVDKIRYRLMDTVLGQIVRLGPVLLAEFYKELNILQDFTQKDDLLIYQVHRMVPKAEFLDRENIPIGRMLGRGVDLLRNRSEKRKILVLFTTSIDRDSVKNLDEYRDMLRFTDIDLFVVSFAPRSVTGPGFSGAERVSQACFRSLVSETGGVLYLSGEYVYVTEFMEDLTARLLNSYTIGFYVPSAGEQSSHAVEIQVARPKCKLRYRRNVTI